MAVLHFQNAVNAHLLWSREFAEYLEGRFVSAEFEDVHRDDLCVIGKWLHGEGACYSHLHQFDTVKALHRDLHALAGQCVQAKKTGDHALLEQLIAKMNRVRHDLFMSWNLLNDLIGAY